MDGQEPKIQGNWLYYTDDSGKRQFTKKVYLGIEDTEFPECTNEEKEKWEAEHPDDVPVTEEPQQEF